MNELFRLAPAVAAGAWLGLFYFGGLWWTVRKGFFSRRPALWFLGSLMFRMAVTLAGLYLIGGTDWRRWLASIVGLVLARVVVKRVTRPPVRLRASPAPETSLAP